MNPTHLDTAEGGSLRERPLLGLAKAPYTLADMNAQLEEIALRLEALNVTFQEACRVWEGAARERAR